MDRSIPSKEYYDPRKRSGDRMRDFLRDLVIPPQAIQVAKVAQAAFASYGPRKAFENAVPAGLEWLSPARLPVLQQRYPVAPPYKYDPESIWARACERRRQVGRVFDVKGSRILELACHDAMVSGLLARDGAQATAIDLSIEHVDPRAIACGVKVKAANAESLPFEDASFDCVFSYNAFEHFPYPEAVLREALRVVRPSGTLFFSFGPLYRSSYGLHAMHAITVPFCQFLWQRPVLENYTVREGLRRIEFETLNEWTVQQFRDLWKAWLPWAQPFAYREIPDVNGMALVREYPTCFRSKVNRFEDLLIAILQVALRRTDRPLAVSANTQTKAISNAVA